MKKTGNARVLRRHGTDAESRLWRALRNRQLSGHKFRRQHPIGPYIADFACMESKLVVELDGGQHAEQAVAHDIKRTAELERLGFRVIRFWNNDVLINLEGVMEAIQMSLDHDR